MVKLYCCTAGGMGGLVRLLVSKYRNVGGVGINVDRSPARRQVLRSWYRYTGKEGEIKRSG